MPTCIRTFNDIQVKRCLPCYNSLTSVYHNIIFSMIDCRLRFVWLFLFSSPSQKWIFMEKKTTNQNKSLLCVLCARFFLQLDMRAPPLGFLINHVHSILYTETIAWNVFKSTYHYSCYWVLFAVSRHPFHPHGHKSICKICDLYLITHIWIWITCRTSQSITIGWIGSLRSHDFDEFTMHLWQVTHVLLPHRFRRIAFSSFWNAFIHTEKIRDFRWT